MLPPAMCHPDFTWAYVPSPLLLLGINCPQSYQRPASTPVRSSLSALLPQDIPLSPAPSLFPTVNTHADEEILPRPHICPLPQPLPPPLLSFTRKLLGRHPACCLQLLPSSPLMNLLPQLGPTSPHKQLLSGLIPVSPDQGHVSEPTAISQTSFAPLLSGIWHSVDTSLFPETLSSLGLGDRPLVFPPPHLLDPNLL